MFCACDPEKITVLFWFVKLFFPDCCHQSPLIVITLPLPSKLPFPFINKSLSIVISVCIFFETPPLDQDYKMNQCL